ncbi:universal stress family protein [Lentilactobacillus senioris DSM 24302 = JCM 17472]|uniref:Universal stress family protein n=2 Tax=Lentilactobacillus senioris TaxID=931534 RepID=A0A0R2CNK8_9LACO|nr:universal stress family protein [Lentilactobacillus senioris DSM 24302 = JCM 17472]
MEAENMYANILVPIDGSENAEKAVKEAIALAQIHHSKLHVVMVATDQRYIQYGVTLGQDVMDQFEKAADKTLQQAEDEIKVAGVAVETHYVVGIPKIQIAEKLPVTLKTDLTVMGKSGMSGISRAFLGSTTEYVVRHSESNVLVVEN